MQFDFSGAFIGLVIFTAIGISVLVTILLSVLKLCGVLLLGWWWVIGLTPAVVLVCLIVILLGAGFDALFR